MWTSGTMRNSLRWSPRSQARVIGRGQVHKDHADLLLCFESCLDVIGQERHLVGGGTAMTETGYTAEGAPGQITGSRTCEQQPLKEF